MWLPFLLVIYFGSCNYLFSKKTWGSSSQGVVFMLKYKPWERLGITLGSQIPTCGHQPAQRLSSDHKLWSSLGGGGRKSTTVCLRILGYTIKLKIEVFQFPSPGMPIQSLSQPPKTLWKGNILLHADCSFVFFHSDFKITDSFRSPLLPLPLYKAMVSLEPNQLLLQ